jgi:hypothetical protein
MIDGAINESSCTKVYTCGSPFLVAKATCLQANNIPQICTHLSSHARGLIKQKIPFCLRLLLAIGLLGSFPHSLLLAATPNTVKPLSQPATLKTGTLEALKGPVLTVPAGTAFTVSLQQPISTQINKVGDLIEAMVETPLTAENKIILPKGSRVKGTIAGIRSSGGAIRSGSLELQFTTAEPVGTTLQLPLLAKVKTPNGSGVLEGEGFKSNAGQIAAKTAIGAATGAAAGSIGGLLRHSNVGNGAIIGASIGAGIGLIHSLFQTKPQPVELESQSPLTLVLEKSLTVGGGNTTMPIQVILPPYSPNGNIVKPTADKPLPNQPVASPEGTGYYGY